MSSSDDLLDESKIPNPNSPAYVACMKAQITYDKASHVNTRFMNALNALHGINDVLVEATEAKGT